MNYLKSAGTGIVFSLLGVASAAPNHPPIFYAVHEENVIFVDYPVAGLKASADYEGKEILLKKVGEKGRAAKFKLPKGLEEGDTLKVKATDAQGNETTQSISVKNGKLRAPVSNDKEQAPLFYFLNQSSLEITVLDNKPSGLITSITYENKTHELTGTIVSQRSVRYKLPKAVKKRESFTINMLDEDGNKSSQGFRILDGKILEEKIE